MMTVREVTDVLFAMTIEASVELYDMYGTNLLKKPNQPETKYPVIPYDRAFCEKHIAGFEDREVVGMFTKWDDEFEESVVHLIIK